MGAADGGLRRVDSENDPDLFWALRGGGGSFGVVTAMEIALYPMPELYAGAMWWPWERATEVMHAWQAVTRQNLYSRKSFRALADWYYLQLKHRQLRRHPRMTGANA